MKEQNAQYIVNLTKQVVGSEEDIKLMQENCADRLSFLSFIRHRTMSKVRKMSPTTLGRICCYGLAVQQLPQNIGGFIKKTSMWDTFPEQVKPDMFNYPGRFVLEQVAAATIAAMANDIIHQNDYKKEAENLHCKYPLHP